MELDKNINADKVRTAYVKFTTTGKTYAYLTDDPDIRRGDGVFIETPFEPHKRVIVQDLSLWGHIDEKCTRFLKDPKHCVRSKKEMRKLKEEENSMKNFNTNKLADRFFKKVDNVVMDLQTGSVGIQNGDSVYTFSHDEAEGDTINENMFAMFSMPLPAFAQATPLDQIKVGDLIAKDTAVGWVTKVNKKTVTVMKTDGGTFNFSPPKNTLMGESQNVMVVRNMMGDSEGLGNMQNMLMPLMMMGGDNSDIESMMPMLLMSQSGMMGDGSNNMLQMMMLAKMMK